MTIWRSVVVGVDASPEAAHAASAGWRVATVAQAGCHLVHGTRRLVDIPSTTPLGLDVQALEQRMTAAALARVRDALRVETPPRALEQLEVLVGHPIVALRRAVTAHGADLVVLGGKHHGRFARWLGGSTVHHALRALDVPILITSGGGSGFAHVLAAVDLSGATRPTVALALRFADLMGAQLRVLYVVPPLPGALEPLPPGLAADEHESAAMRELQHVLGDVAPQRNLDRVVRHGRPDEAIAAESATWPADLIVVGSHGRGWVERIVIGSTTERLVNDLPTSLLVAPVSEAAAPRSPSGAEP